MSTHTLPEADITLRMQRMYRPQRLVYDLSRRYYLIGRDRLLDGIEAAPGGSVLDMGCGTGRNLVRLAGRLPEARLFGLDAARVMLEEAEAKTRRKRLGRRLEFAHGVAEELSPRRMFGVDAFDHILFSYSLSMIDSPTLAVLKALAALRKGGRLHIVDFGDMADLPRPLQSGLAAWLRCFGVEHRPEVRRLLLELEARGEGRLEHQRLMGGYAELLRFTHSPRA